MWGEMRSKRASRKHDRRGERRAVWAIELALDRGGTFVHPLFRVFEEVGPTFCERGGEGESPCKLRSCARSTLRGTFRRVRCAGGKHGAIRARTSLLLVNTRPAHRDPCLRRLPAGLPRRTARISRPGTPRRPAQTPLPQVVVPPPPRLLLRQSPHPAPGAQPARIRRAPPLPPAARPPRRPVQPFLHVLFCSRACSIAAIMQPAGGAAAPGGACAAASTVPPTVRQFMQEHGIDDSSFEGVCAHVRRRSEHVARCVSAVVCMLVPRLSQHPRPRTHARTHACAHARAGHKTRHIRINPRRPIALALLAAQLGHTPTPVAWLPHIFSLP